MTTNIRRLALAALVLCAVRSLGAQELGIQVGSAAPDARVQTLDGQPVNLERYIGKVPLLLEFWATWCGNCRELEPALHAVQRKYAGRLRVVAIAVSVNQSPERVKLYARKHGFTHEILYDRTGAASAAYDAPATSYVVIVDRRGKVVYTGLGGGQDLDAAVGKVM